jgi:hypothetical protein
LNRILRGAWALAAVAVVALSGCSDDDEKQCEDFCGTGAACVGGACAAVASCSPTCSTGQACQDGACVATLASACTGGCAADQICVTSGSAASCVAVCGDGQAWNSTTSTCMATSAYCGAGLTWDATINECRLASGASIHAAYFDGKTLASGPAVTAECVKCHAHQAMEMMQTQHWTWKGPTPQLQALGGDFQLAEPLAALNPGNIGKANLINNFCVAVASNEKRCDQCHAGYGGDPDTTKPQVSARAYTTETSSIPLEHRIDCLVCHSAPSAGYKKDLKNFGLPATTVNLSAAAAAIVGTPTRENCGVCHFYAGGGDNVKLMGSSLKNPTADLDVHMGRGMTCAGCHAEPGHQFKGAGIHVPSNTARASCEDCHDKTTAAFTAVATHRASHLAALACQTCHIPAFSRGQFGKMDWDWSTAGDKTRGTNGVVKEIVNDAGEPVAEGTEVVTYDYIKGDFLWQRNVKPAYAWYNGKMTHVTAMDKGAFSVETGTTTEDGDRITLGMPLGSAADATAKIYPFKLMRGRQAVYVDGASSFVLVPNVFGPAGFWGVIQSAGYTYDPATGNYTTDAVTTPTPLDALWSTNLTTGAKKAGQIPADAATLEKYAGEGTVGWDWRYTKLYMDMNHEVAPKAQAIGAGGNCAACHTTGTPVIDWMQLGYTCNDPMNCRR